MNRKKVALIAGIVLIIAAAGAAFLNKDRIQEHFSRERLVKDVLAAVGEKETPSIITDPSMQVWLEEKNADVALVECDMNAETIRDQALVNETDYLILPAGSEAENQELFAEYGISLLETVGDYHIYGNSKKYHNVYTITQYAEVNGAQGMFYTITDLEDHLVIVDGGWDADAEQVLNVIIDHDSRVDTWILTHPHQDHISAFENLMEGDFDIDIGTIYTIDLDYDYYESVAAQADGGFEFYERFLKIAEDMDNIEYLHTGDELDLYGMDMKVMNAYDDSYEKYGDPANNGSLMFKLMAEDESMLFCADVTGTMSQILMDKWGDELKSDYVQMSHHGIGGTFDPEVYDLIDPSVAFFDIPEWMNKTEDMNSKEYYDQLTEMGATVYNFGTAPNSIELK